MFRLIGIVFLLLTVHPSFGWAQEELPPQLEGPYEFVSGTIAELPPGKIVVNRAVTGKPAENRTFAITGETKVEGRLRVRARVTVGFKTTDEGEPVAVRIIVRAQNLK